MTKQQDKFQDKIITKVKEGDKGWTITTDDHWSFFVPKQSVVPSVGQIARFYGDGIGSRVRGLDINGQEIFYRSPEQQRERLLQEVAEMDERKKLEFEKNKSELDAKYNSLPKEFRERLDGFRAANPDFRWENESYEMFCCQQAVEIANAFLSKATQDLLNNLPVDKKAATYLEWFKILKFQQQKMIVPALSNDHSGNTFGAACNLAWLYLTSPNLVPKQHGALCPLVGCKEYGCYAGRK
jgi:hypothetical protein